MAITISDTAMNAMLTTLNTQIGTNAKINVYDGTQPASGGALSGNTLLAELIGDATTFGTVATRTLTAETITGDAAGNATGTPTWFRLTTSGDAFVIDGTAAVGSGDLNFNEGVTSGESVDINSLTISGGN